MPPESSAPKNAKHKGPQFSPCQWARLSSDLPQNVVFVLLTSEQVTNSSTLQYCSELKTTGIVSTEKPCPKVSKYILRSKHRPTPSFQCFPQKFQSFPTPPPPPCPVEHQQWAECYCRRSCPDAILVESAQYTNHQHYLKGTSPMVQIYPQVSGWALPSEKWWTSSVGVMTFPIW